MKNHKRIKKDSGIRRWGNVLVVTCLFSLLSQLPGKSQSQVTGKPSAEMPQRTRKMAAMLKKWREDITANMPVSNPDYRSRKK